MDTLEEANNRLLVRREQHQANMPTSRLKSLTMTIPEIQAKIQAIIKENQLQACEKCGTQCQQGICNACIEVEKERQGIEREKRLDDIKKANYDNFLREAGIPKMFMTVQPKEDNRSLFIAGSFGSGKTHYAVSAMKNYINCLPNTCFVSPFNKLPLFITIPELLLKIRSTFSLERCEEEIVDKYSNTPLLILDDLGAEKTTEFSLQTLYIILNRRYNEQLQTIITSNLTLDEVKDRLGDRIASRIAGMCSVLHMKGHDKRLTKSQRSATKE